MKFIVLACLIAAAVAEPAADADPALLYSNYGYNYGAYPYAFNGYSAYARPYAAYSYGAFPYYNRFAYRSFYKREAEAEPEADPALLYNNFGYAYGAYPYAYNTALTYAAPAYTTYAATPFTYGAYAGAYASAGRYVANSGGALHIAKREAEAEADPALLYSNYGYNYGAYPYAAYSAYRPYAAYKPYAAYRPYAAYNYGRYYW